MNRKLLAASRRLGKTDIKTEFEGVCAEVKWLRGMQLDPGEKISMHSHLSFEFHIVKEGACQVTLLDGEYIFLRGEAYITPPHLSHEQLSVGEEPYVEYCLNCNISLDEERIENAHINALFTGTELGAIKQSAPLEKYFEMIFNYAEKMRASDLTNIKLAVHMIINTAAALLGDTSCTSAPKPISEIDERFDLLRGYIVENIDNDPKLSDMAKIFYLSEKQISRIIKTSTGKSGSEYILALRFDRAKLYIQTDNISFAEIAKKMHFTTPEYFSRFFKKRSGLSPSEFKNKYFKTEKPCKYAEKPK